MSNSCVFENKHLSFPNIDLKMVSFVIILSDKQKLGKFINQYEISNELLIS